MAAQNRDSERGALRFGRPDPRPPFSKQTDGKTSDALCDMAAALWDIAESPAPFKGRAARALPASLPGPAP
jgi:hypothetical protein